MFLITVWVAFDC